MLNLKPLRLVILMASLSIAAVAVADDWLPVSIDHSHPETTNLTAEQTAATVWQLTEEEYQHYESLMQGMSGRWYVDLNPPEVLGINALDEQTLDHFAQIVARQRYERISRELKFQQAVNKAWRALYPNLPAVKSPATTLIATTTTTQPRQTTP